MNTALKSIFRSIDLRFVWLIAILAIALALRFMVAMDDPWLDEVWSWHMVQESNSAFAAVFNRHDNNHILNTLVLCLVGDVNSWLPYRIPAIVAGVISVWLAFVIGRRMTTRFDGGLIVAALFATSFFQVVYTSEARGYAYVILFALAAWWTLDVALTTGRWFSQLLFGFFVVLGLCAHLGFLHFYLAAVPWTMAHLWRHRQTLVQATTAMLQLHLLPTAFLGLLAILFIKGMKHGGKSGLKTMDLLHDTFAWTFGIPEAPGYATAIVVVGGLILVSLLAWEFRRTRAEGDTRGIFMLGVMGIPPAMMVVLNLTNDHVPWPYPRYFTISITFLLLLLGCALTMMFAQGHNVRRLAIVLFALVLGGNLMHVTSLVQQTRGDYSEVVKILGREARSKGLKPLLFTGQPFRVRMMNHWFLRNELDVHDVFDGKLIGAKIDACLVEIRDRYPHTGPDLELGGILRTWYEVPQRAKVPLGWPSGPMRRIAEIDYYGPSGFRWVVYVRR